MSLVSAGVPSPEASRHFEAILQPDLTGLYAARAARLRQLSEGHELEQYLRFATDVVEGQGECVAAGASGWPEMLDRIVAHLRPRAPEVAAAHLDRLSTMPETELRAAADALATGRFDDIDAAIAPVLWAALSVDAAQAARSRPLPASSGQETAECPCCGTAPVASVIHLGEQQGMRYLHCALCETDWHMVRAKCSNCGEAGQLDYLSFDTPEATVRAEACSACGSYLKVISQERDPQAEGVADDLASLVLDDAAVAEGFERSGFNPFALPAV